MTDAAPSVALLFDDGELVAQLRDALHACGARIVHEGGIANLNGQVLQQVNADVLVINLDDAAADALDRLYALVEGERPRLVFNDAEASANLTGWDRARWARHLAAKIFQMGDTDPPRPADARGVEVAPLEADDAAPVAGDEPAHPEEAPFTGTQAESGVDDPQGSSGMHETDDVPGDHHGPEAAQRRLGETEALSAELEALLASAELMDSETHDDTGGEDMAKADASELPNLENQPDAHDGDGDGDVPLPMAVAGLDDLLDVLPKDDRETSPQVTLPAGTSAPVLPHAPADWALVDDDAITPATFGVQKQTAADFLAPDAEKVADDDEPVLNLELVSMEEAIAPRPAAAAIEMHLDELQMALSHLVLTGATLGGSVGAFAFYAAMPATTQLTFLHTQHLGGQSAADLVEQLTKACPLKVTLAVAGASAEPGEILVVPPGHAVRIRRDGQVEVRASGEELQDPSIDDSLKMAAEIFGRDAVAIVFSGHSTDSIAGAKAVNTGGGRVWVESAAPEYADLVHEITAAKIVDYSGTPLQLASHLMETIA